MTSEERKRIEQGKRLEAARRAAGYRSARAAALDNGWPESTYRAHEGGTRTIGQDDAERYTKRFRALGATAKASDVLFETGASSASERSEVPVMGYIGAGAEIMPEFEQVPPEGLDTVELPFNVPEGIIAFRVRGESMLPAYREGDAVLVHKDQRLATENYVGEEAAVRTSDGRRFLKEIQYGQRRGFFNLYSYNAKLIENAHLEWVGEMYLVVKAQQIRRIEQTRRAAISKRQAVLDRETDGMDELPLQRAK